jgi:asparagine synthase (glutamine-hydrolysing)
MCGIAGFLVPENSLPAGGFATELGNMAAALLHRGPDDQGIWSAPAHGIGFCHRRLSIVDLSPLGHQPMLSASGRYVVTFNGEIYNYQELRRELLELGHRFRGTSDTEVLLACIEAWGIEAALQKSTGMFALGVWDHQHRLLHLARDRFGEKPLYMGRFGGVFGFASELKALRAHSAWEGDIDRDAVALLMKDGYVPAPLSIFRQVRKLHAGSMATIGWRGANIQVVEKPYWSASTAIKDCVSGNLITTGDEAIHRVEQALIEAVRRQMVADVPVGAFLSGGIDSSLVVGVMQSLCRQPVRSFSIGFWEDEFNEAPFAKAVAQHLGTQHTELTVTAADALAVIPHLPQLYDEPFGDSSQIPTVLLARLTRQSVTVSLSGDAGDELFGGYTRYTEGLQSWNQLHRIPQPLRAAAGAVIGALPTATLTAATNLLRLSDKLRHRIDLADRLQERAVSWGATSMSAAYESMFAQWNSPERLVLGTSRDSLRRASPLAMPAGLDPMQQMMYGDMCRYMTDDVLVKVDRAAMASSLETRVPLLDPEVVLTAWRIPTRVHRQDGRGKWVLRQLLDKYVPRPLIDRPKRGFGVPIGRWLRSELRPWAEDMLDSQRLRREGFLDGALIERRWRQHLSGHADWSYHLWNVLMYQAWLDGSSRDQRASA